MLPAALGAVGGLLLLLVLARGADEVLPWALAILGAAYTVSLVTHGSGVDEGVPLVAVGLLLSGELAAWSLDERHAIAAERKAVALRAGALALLAAAGLVAATVVVALSAAPAGEGLAWTVAGAAAAVLAVGVADRVARR
ncbi:MAG: hypothetical protein V7644_153 [Actinomycetota bacterium]